MAITAPELLLGPRGRRLCIEYALRSEALAAGPVETELPLWKALFDTVVAQQDQVACSRPPIPPRTCCWTCCGPP